jgi:hypothetical protein
MPANPTAPTGESRSLRCLARAALTAGTSSTMISTAEKVKENRVRRDTEYQCFALDKSRCRDTVVWDYDRYWVVDPNAELAATDPLARTMADFLAFELHLGKVEEWLPTPPSGRVALSETFSRRHGEQR